MRILQTARPVLRPSRAVARDQPGSRSRSNKRRRDKRIRCVAVPKAGSTPHTRPSPVLPFSCCLSCRRAVVSSCGAEGFPVQSHFPSSQRSARPAPAPAFQLPHQPAASCARARRERSRPARVSRARPARRESVRPRYADARRRAARAASPRLPEWRSRSINTNPAGRSGSCERDRG